MKKYYDKETGAELKHCPVCGYNENEKITIPIYYAEIEGKKVIDEDSIREEFEEKLKRILGETEYICGNCGRSHNNEIVAGISRCDRCKDL